MKRIISVKATVNLRHKYICDRCQKEKYGEVSIVEFTDLNNPLDLHYRVDELLPPAYEMPINWSQNVKVINGKAELIFHCDKCCG